MKSLEMELTFDCPKIAPVDGERLLLVSLNRSFDSTKAIGIYKRTDEYDATRKYWRINIDRAKKVDYVLGVYKGIVCTVYKPSAWESYTHADDGTPFKTRRYGFVGEKVPESPYLNTSVAEYPFGRGGVITYIPRDKAKW